jgi:hypothetical protein
MRFATFCIILTPALSLALFSEVAGAQSSVGIFDSWSYRLSLHKFLPHTRYFVGGTVVGKADPPPSTSTADNFTATAYLFLFGARF